MKDQDQFLEWYQKQFDKIVDPPPDEVWNNISKELDVNDVWNKIDSRLNSIDRRKVFVRRTVYAFSFLLLLLSFGGIIFRTYINTENKTILAENENNRFKKSNISVYDGKTNHTEQEFTKSTGTSGEHNVSKSSSINSPNSLLETNQHSISKQQEKNSAISENNSNKPGDEIISAANTDNENNIIGLTQKDTSTLKGVKNSRPNLEGSNTKDSIAPFRAGELFIASIPISPLSVKAFDSIAPCLTLSPPLSKDSNQYAQLSIKNEFYGFYSGGIFSMNNIWLLNQLTFDGLKTNSLNETKIDFGYSYGMSAGYNISEHFGGELEWHINSQQGQSYNMYDEGKYVTKQISMDYTVFNLSLKCRNQGYNARTKTPNSQNLLIGINIGMLKRGKNNVDTQLEDITTCYYKTNYGLRLGYEYEVIAFHKILLSSALIGNFGLKNVYKGNSYIPAGFNRTQVASMGLNIGVKYLLR